MSAQSSDPMAQIEADFRARAIAAGKAAPEYLTVVDDEYGYAGDPEDLAALDAPQAPAARAASPEYLELEVEGVAREVALRLKDGGIHTINIPPLTMGQIAMLGWHQDRVGKRHAELLKAADPAAAQRLADRVTNAQREQVVFMIPDFPRELFDRMRAGTFSRLLRVFDEMAREAAGLDDPNPDPAAGA